MAGMADGMIDQHTLNLAAAALVEAGEADEVWVEVPGAFVHVMRAGHDPHALLRAMCAGRIEIRYFGPDPQPPGDPDPHLCGVNAGALLRWMTAQTRKRRLH